MAAELEDACSALMIIRRSSLSIAGIGYLALAAERLDQLKLRRAESAVWLLRHLPPRA